MAPVAYGNDEISDENYLILMAKKYQVVDPPAARAWMITAKSLFPGNFVIQYEAYCMAKESGNVKEAALNLEEMIKVFSDQRMLWAEMQKIATALRNSSKDGNSEFLREIFSQLSSEVKHEMLLAVADHSDDTMEHCRLMLLMLQKLPDKIMEHGAKLIETLFTAEKHGHCHLPGNKFRKLLVCDVMPLILSSPSVLIPARQMFRLLQKSVEFYVCYITQLSKKDVEQGSSSQRSEERYKIDTPIEDPWDQLFSLMESSGRKLEWELADIFSPCRNGFTANESISQRIITFFQNKPYYSDSAGNDSGMSLMSGTSSGEEAITAHYKQVFFSAAVIFLRCLFQFAKLVNPEWFAGATNGELQYVLIEGIYSRYPHEDTADYPKHKRRKVESEARDHDTLPLLTVSKSASSEFANTLTQSFLMALKCWELLHSSHSLKKELNRLSQHIHMDSWPWFQEFFIDSLIYQGYNKEAIANLLHIQKTASGDHMKNKISLQLASCLYAIGDLPAACEHLLDVICTFPSSSSPSTNTSSVAQEPIPQPRRPGRHLHFINYRRGEILQHCVKLLITCFKEKTLYSGGKDDMALGHLLVLSQYGWPQEENLFLQCLELIKKHKSFCYGLFFNYIINTDILEEFMYLTTSAGGNVSLDLLPTSTVQVGKQRAVTRGVNKEAKEDLKLAMEKQMARCEENLDHLLVEFFKQERSLLRKNIQ